MEAAVSQLLAIGLRIRQVRRLLARSRLPRLAMHVITVTF